MGQGRDEVATVIESVSLERTMCYGTCPAYSVTLERDGPATWHGEMYVDLLGDYSGVANGRDFDALCRFIERTGFFNWEKAYTAMVTDKPYYTIKVRRGSQTKAVLQYAVDDPPDFWVIAKLVDTIAQKVAWKPATAALTTSANPVTYALRLVSEEKKVEGAQREGDTG